MAAASTDERAQKITHVDVAIVGAGTAGLAALREVRDRTDNFVLINAGPYGTTCARVGCMPSKAVIAAANAFHSRVKLEEFGIRGGERLRADIPAVFRRVRSLRDYFVSGVLKATKDLGARNISGRARLDGPTRLIVGERVIQARQIVLVPGSSPIVPEPWRALGDRILTSDALFDQEDLPSRIGVIGLGPLGAEIAQALARLGLEVHGFDGGEQIAGISDEKVAAAAQSNLAEEFAIHLGAEVELAEADGGVEIKWRGGSVNVDKVIAAIGRRPNVDGLGLKTLGVPLDEKGMPEVDPTTMRIGATPIFLVGDANGDKPLLHEAADEGHIAGLNATSEEPIRLSRRTRLSVVFCDPGIAAVGQKAKDLDPETTLIGEASFADQGRARIMQENYGLLRLYAARRDGRLLGAEMAVPVAEHIAHLLALAIGQELTVHDLLRMPFYHPTLEEGLRTALRTIARELPPCGLSDLARCGALGIEALE
ncbi:MAG: dihydrolipoyl dehydrogenase [Hyphomicrobiales bacterium]|nr:dihydrolipoyl dehydrogenase [Hyphomicrobiales bacterium]